MRDESFELKRAYHAMQAAQKEMQESQEKLNIAKYKSASIYREIGDLQSDFDKLKTEKDAEWAEFCKKLDDARIAIGEKISAIKVCNEKEEEFKNLANDSSLPEEHQVIYASVARYLSKLASEKMLERDDLITRKRKMTSPDMSRIDEMKEKLADLRMEQDEIVEKYHEAKNSYGLKKTSFDRAKAKYDALNDPENAQDVNTFSSRPQRMELDENLLKLANISKEYWGNCTMERRVDGKIDIYYGGGNGYRHGHAIIAGNSVEFSRKPEKVSETAS